MKRAKGENGSENENEGGHFRYPTLWNDRMDWMGHRSMSANDPTASKHIKGAEEGGINLANYISALSLGAILQETLHIGTFSW